MFSPTRDYYICGCSSAKWSISQRILQVSAGGWPLSSVILGGFGAGGTAALLGLLFPQLAGLVSLSPKHRAGACRDRLRRNTYCMDRPDRHG